MAVLPNDTKQFVSSTDRELESSRVVPQRSYRSRILFGGQLLLFVGLLWQFIMLYKSYFATAAAVGLVDANVIKRASSSSSSSTHSSSSSSSNIPDYYVTKPELLPGKPNTNPSTESQS
jgi:hypothetical protein